MNMNGLGRISFILSLSLTLLISGVILFYCINRFKHLETNIIEQGKILQSFIITAENQKCNLYSNIALDSAKQQANKFSNINKIEVSDDEYDNCSNKKMCQKNKNKSAADDEDDEDDDDDDDDEDDDDADDNDDEDDDDDDDDDDDNDDDDDDDDDDNIRKQSKEHFNAFKNILCGHLDCCDNTAMNIIKNNNEITDVIHVIDVIDVFTISDVGVPKNVSNLTDLTNLTDITDITDMNEVNEVTEVTDVTDVKTNTEPLVNKVKKVNLNRLKLQELRDLVLEKNPDLKNNISNIKKEELIKILNQK